MKVGDKYEITSDKYQWILTEYVDGKDKDGYPKIQPRDSYHGTIQQCCETIIQRDAKQAERLGEVIDEIRNSTYEIVRALEKNK